MFDLLLLLFFDSRLDLALVWWRTLLSIFLDLMVFPRKCCEHLHTWTVLLSGNKAEVKNSCYFLFLSIHTCNADFCGPLCNALKSGSPNFVCQYRTANIFYHHLSCSQDPRGAGVYPRCPRVKAVTPWTIPPQFFPRPQKGMNKQQFTSTDN